MNQAENLINLSNALWSFTIRQNHRSTLPAASLMVFEIVLLLLFQILSSLYSPNGSTDFDRVFCKMIAIHWRCALNLSFFDSSIIDRSNRQYRKNFKHLLLNFPKAQKVFFWWKYRHFGWLHKSLISIPKSRDESAILKFFKIST